MIIIIIIIYTSPIPISTPLVRNIGKKFIKETPAQSCKTSYSFRILRNTEHKTLFAPVLYSDNRKIVTSTHKS